MIANQIASDRLLFGRRDLRHWARALAIGSLVHLTLPDIRQESWTFPALLEGLGALLLLWRPMPLGFLLSCLGTLWPLLFLRDVLTQSMLLTWMAALGMMGGLSIRLDILSAVRWITAGTYWLAALHKLNRDFFDPDISCAHHGLEALRNHWSNMPFPADVGVELSIALIALEFIMGILIIGRSIWVWPVGVAFHLPLTVTLAPAFAFVMFSGYASALTGRQLVVLRSCWRHHRSSILIAGCASALIESLLTHKTFDFGVALKVAVMGSLLWWSIIAIAFCRSRIYARRIRVHLWGQRRSRRIIMLVFLLWVLHGLTPYFSLQYQHTAAMLSNLRIDEQCHNSLVFSPALATPDPYIRINEAEFRNGLRARRVEVLKAGLWSVPALATMHRNWCIEELRPIRLVGRWYNRDFVIADLCDPDWYRSIGLADTRWSGFQRFQKNLLRRCDAPCVH